MLEDVKIGDSIAVNGVCLTVTTFGEGIFTADVMAETLARTNLKELRPGSKVNLERALRLGDRLGGHLVSGHVDGIGTIIGTARHDIATLVTVQAPDEVMKYIIKKGSVAIDGTSLTVVDFDRDKFQVSLIPHTAQVTVLGSKKIGDTVNLEADVLGKYIERLLQAREERPVQNSKISQEFLSAHGFL
ncbi:Riboflavin synthase alpha chain [Desulforamulus hydrothermalis Lam5 = DSM 18033]|uniref:Riboflavin synthase n=1 Tax=Desulforamulus hydrothermalis Lam5 = DSM 18033 TaxID=1121428 RepID=K8DX02_9FIRM|nr:Riboflavin synthase alpha chain [Desulforamulus hydrothermalis Lam5 = DSM 18033]SHG96742.1 riboflavin synthase alpha chain [Desulforamulus hydrothermalis Lam5 = DSM 18033]